MDREGGPIAGVTIHPGIEFKKRPGDLRQLGIGDTLKTDNAGMWRFDSVPASLSEVFVQINHADFMPNHRSLTRREFGIDHSNEPAGRVITTVD